MNLLANNRYDCICEWKSVSDRSQHFYYIGCHHIEATNNFKILKEVCTCSYVVVYYWTCDEPEQCVHKFYIGTFLLYQYSYVKFIFPTELSFFLLLLHISTANPP